MTALQQPEKPSGKNNNEVLKNRVIFSLFLLSFLSLYISFFSLFFFSLKLLIFILATFSKNFVFSLRYTLQVMQALQH